MEALQRILLDRDESAPLDVAALELARVEYPGMELEPFLDLLSSHARELDDRVSAGASGVEFVKVACEYLFDELGFRGNTERYYSVENSCLSQVLLNRTGIPITLAVVMIEIARRIDRPIFGVSLPGHFIARYGAEGDGLFIDCFHGGRLMDADQCRELALEVSGVDIASNPALLEPATKRSILVRMLNNLRNAYLREENFSSQIAVLDLLLLAMPQSADEYKQRGVCHMATKQYGSALADFQRYLELCPQAADRVLVEEQAERLRRFLETSQ